MLYNSAIVAVPVTIAAVSLLSSSVRIESAQIGPDAFSLNAYRQDFNGLQFGTFPSPRILGGIEFDGGDQGIRVSSKLAPIIGRDGVAIQTNPSDELNPELRIVLPSPREMIGFYVGAEFEWNTSVRFFDSNELEVGVIELTGVGRDGYFAGWKSDDRPVNTITVRNDFQVPLVQNLSLTHVIIDDLMTQVPEPTNAAFLALLFAWSWCLRCRND